MAEKQKFSLREQIGAAVGAASVAAMGAAVSESDTQREQIAYLPRTSLVSDPKNFYRLDGIDELAANIETVGLLDPLIVRPCEDEPELYRIISGHRRRAAIDKLALAGNRSFELVPCIIKRDAVSPAMQELRLIMANSDTRRMTSADIATQAERVEALLLQLKKEGYQFQGRMREHVAEICKVNETKLATIAAIKSKLRVPGFIDAWKEGRLNESVAYEISKLLLEHQYRLLDWRIDNGVAYENITARDVKRLDTIFTFTERNCPKASRGPCTNGERMYSAFFRSGEWNCAGCCAKCLKRDSCHVVCSHCKPAPKPEGKTAAVAKNPALDDPRTDWNYSREQFCGRLRAARERTGLDRRQFAESISEYPNTYSAWENASLPGSDHLAKLALSLGVSLDYLFGLTSEPTGSAIRPEQWRRAGVPDEGRLYMLFRLTNAGPEYRAAIYHDGVWCDPKSGTKPLTGFMPQCFIRIPWPEKDMK